jgi:hypothetical protein
VRDRRLLQVREVLVAATTAEGAPSGPAGSAEAGSSSMHAQEGSPLDPSLRRLIEGLELGGTTAQVVQAARAWCEAEGVTSAGLLLEAEMEDEFVKALQLKTAPKKVLLKRLKALPRSSGGEDGPQLSGKI